MVSNCGQKHPPWKCPDPKALFRGFSWHSTVAEVRRSGKKVLVDASAERKKTGVAWVTLRDVEEGIYIGFKQCATFNAGYLWFLRQLGNLVEDAGITAKWCVIGHAESYQEHVWTEAKHFLGVPAASSHSEITTAATAASSHADLSSQLGEVGTLAWARRGLVLKTLSGDIVLARSREDYSYGARLGTQASSNEQSFKVFLMGVEISLGHGMFIATAFLF